MNKIVLNRNKTTEKMLSLILFVVLPLISSYECKSMNNETTPGTETVTDFEEIIMVDDQFMGNLSDLNPFDKQVIVEKTVHYYRRHLTNLGKAIRKVNDPNIWENYKTIESELDLSESIYLKNPDLDKFQEAMAILSMNLMDLQNNVIDKLTTDQTIDKSVKLSKSGLSRRYESEELIDIRLHELWKYLKEFTRFVEEVIDDLSEK